MICVLSYSDAAERYKLQRDVIASYSVLSMGVACFQRQPSADIMQTSCRVEAFNVWLLSQQSYTIDPSSAKFLIDHGFDFNKQFRCGLPYTPVHACQELKVHKCSCIVFVPVSNGKSRVYYYYSVIELCLGKKRELYHQATPKL